jgi:hypothetical protein
MCQVQECQCQYQAQRSIGGEGLCIAARLWASGRTGKVQEKANVRLRLYMRHDVQRRMEQGVISVGVSVRRRPGGYR